MHLWVENKQSHYEKQVLGISILLGAYISIEILDTIAEGPVSWQQKSLANTKLNTIFVICGD